MTTDTDKEPQPVKRADHVKLWLRDPSFWRDFTVNTLSGLTVAFIAYWGLLLVGLVQTSNNLRTSYIVTLIMGIVVVSAWWESRSPYSRARDWIAARLSPRLPRWFALGAIHLSALLLLLGSFVAIGIGVGLVLWPIFNGFAVLLRMDAHI